MSASAASEEIVLVSSDGEKFTVPRKVAVMSELVKNMVEEGASRQQYCAWREGHTGPPDDVVITGLGRHRQPPSVRSEGDSRAVAHRPRPRRRPHSPRANRTSRRHPLTAGASEEVPLMDVKASVLSKVIEFCKQHMDNKLPEIEKVRAAQCSTPRE